MSGGFVLDSRLEADTRHLTSLPLCDVRLMNDARFPWLVLVPRQPQLVELLDLSDEASATLWKEIRHIAAVLREIVPCDKINIGALGNIVRQLHIHIVARKEGDAAWPGPVWGSGRAQPYGADDLHSLAERLKRAMDVSG
ncbi:HIT domain-containing protein [Dyella monticola]|uniref:HIT domain-containing protein n=1 Tax=Dyella monticola TaxID=1927958 RepID=A0A370WUM6_9GAMM|nr:HIT family protein [Dyella monticola]RDS79854.1 HIT domain-containing protein [Dyella monticola]